MGPLPTAMLVPAVLAGMAMGVTLLEPKFVT